MDLVRVRRDQEVVLALLANGYECGFSTCWPPASRLILDLFEAAWDAAAGNVEQRLEAAFRRACREFADQCPALVAPDSDFPNDTPTATLLAVAIHGDRGYAAWIGDDVAVVASGFHALIRTTPHTLVERFKREHPDDDLNGSSLPNVLVRSIGDHTNDDGEPERAVFDITPGDTLVLYSNASLWGTGLPPDDAAFAAAAFTSPAVLAEFLAQRSFDEGDASYAAVAVVRFDDIDVPLEVERLIDLYEPPPPKGDWLRAWCLEHRALPVRVDAATLLAFRPNGSVLRIGYDDEYTAREDAEPATHLAATIGAAKTYPSLASLGPRRPTAASDCEHCRARPDEATRGCPRVRERGMGSDRGRRMGSGRGRRMGSGWGRR